MSIWVNLALGRLRTTENGSAALSHATYVVNELAKGAVDTLAVDATIYRDLGSLFERLARGAERDAHLRRALDCWRQSEVKWRDPKVPREMWARRDEQLRLLQIDIERVDRLLVGAK